MVAFVGGALETDRGGSLRKPLCSTYPGSALGTELGGSLTPPLDEASGCVSLDSTGAGGACEISRDGSGSAADNLRGRYARNRAGRRGTSGGVFDSRALRFRSNSRRLTNHRARRNPRRGLLLDRHRRGLRLGRRHCLAQRRPCHDFFVDPMEGGVTRAQKCERPSAISPGKIGPRVQLLLIVKDDVSSDRPREASRPLL